jgi:hypothetical protein
MCGFDNMGDLLCHRHRVAAGEMTKHDEHASDTIWPHRLLDASKSPALAARQGHLAPPWPPAAAFP